MSLITVIWSMVGSASLTLAVIHFGVWCKNPKGWTQAVFSCLAVGTSVAAAGELWMMHSETPAEFGLVLRWTHLPAWVIVVSLVCFVRLSMKAGRPWLAWTVCLVRTLSLVLNFVFTPNLNYREITGLDHIRFLGETVVIAKGVVNPWMLVGQTSFFLLVVFVVDAALTVWRRGNRRQALLLGGSVVIFVIGGVTQSACALWGVVPMPIMSSFFFLGVLAAMGYDLSESMFRSAQLAAELVESEERLSLAADAAGFGVWMWTVTQDHIWGTERWHRLFGFQPGEAVNLERLAQRIHPEDRTRVEDTLRQALVDHADYAVEYRVVLPGGDTGWRYGLGRMHPAENGNPARILGATTDITERKHSELKIAEQRSELTHVARVSALGQLASSLAHEISQPLGAILRNAEAAEMMLQEPTPDLEEVRAILADIRTDDHRAGEVIDGMRSLMKRRDVEHSLLDLKFVVGEVINLVRSDAVMRQVLLRLDTDSALPLVRGDRVQLQQVLLNLLLNAMDALNEIQPPVKRQVVVKARAAGECIEVTVTDNGHGIPEDKLLPVFEPFFTSKPEGLGMGLAISHDIIQSHGGRLWAENAAAGGAAFTFTLPVEQIS